MTNLLQFTVIGRKSQSHPQRILQLVGEKIVCCSSDLILAFVYAGNSIQNASEQFVSRIHLSFVNFAFRPNPQAKI